MAKIEQLFTYPLESAAAYEVDESEVTETGLDHDRMFRVVSGVDEVVSQLGSPKLATVQLLPPSSYTYGTHKMQLVVPDLITKGKLSIINATKDELVFDEESCISDENELVEVRGPLDNSVSLLAHLAINSHIDNMSGSLKIVKTELTPFNQLDHNFKITSGYPTSNTEINSIVMMSRSSLRYIENATGLEIDMNRFRPNIVIDDLNDEPLSEQSLVSVNINGQKYKTLGPAPVSGLVNINQETGIKDVDQETNLFFNLLSLSGATKLGVGNAAIAFFGVHLAPIGLNDRDNRIQVGDRLTNLVFED